MGFIRSRCYYKKVAYTYKGTCVINSFVGKDDRVKLYLEILQVFHINCYIDCKWHEVRHDSTANVLYFHLQA